jgi:hypothetical protein
MEDLFLKNAKLLSSHALLYPPNQPRQHRAWAALHKLRHAIGQHVLHALRPTDGKSIYSFIFTTSAGPRIA